VNLAVTSLESAEPLALSSLQKQEPEQMEVRVMSCNPSINTDCLIVQLVGQLTPSSAVAS
jgi:hypothetical protein